MVDVTLHINRCHAGYPIAAEHSRELITHPVYV
jgi:hypothetical protein